ncbi:LysR family transcriptional regulator [Methylobacterium sp. J-078]|uniref:LysR family transcriptional regulator n=1 Tax=Methylobacterium sp. J-078 TaxID=2836657 RepID=UPI001FBB2FE9|nr:LysR family transcriptional regulator [Methylobacterium sp. J-078]MCJ2046857.1 LysR family transcriptional regulator [Methylobacterium sp. J-078]
MQTFDLLDWNDIKVFLGAARGGSLAAAAKRLRVDQSTVSRRLASLESALGLALFERLPSGLRLSDVGQRLLQHAEQVESAVISLQHEDHPGNGCIGGRVRLATMEGIASLYLAERLWGLRERHPALTVDLVTSAQTVYVNRREADLFLSFFKPPGKGLISQQIGAFRLGLYAAPSYLARQGCPVDLRSLKQHHFVSYVDDLVQVDCVRWLDDLIEEPQTVFRSNSMIAQKSAALGGFGLVLLPSFAVTARDDLVPVLHDTAFTVRELWLNVHADLQFAPRVRAVMAYLKDTFTSDIQFRLSEAKPPRNQASLQPPPCADPSAHARLFNSVT